MGSGASAIAQATSGNGTGAAPHGTAGARVTPPHFFADLYTFDWTKVGWRLAGVSASAVALCLVVGIALGHPGGALIAAGGALTIGFGPNQRIADSRIRPMLFAVFSTSTATLAGTLVGHRGYAMLLAAAVSAAIYGVLTVRNTGLAWVGQQASVALFVASAFPTGPKAALTRMGLIAAGGVVQLLITTAGLHMMPELRCDVLAISRRVYASVADQRLELLRRLAALGKALPAPDLPAARVYALRLLITVVVASEMYRRMGIQSGYWVPMTALLVQKPAAFETLSRGLARVLGTIAGAVLATLAASHLHPGPWMLAALVTFWAFWSFATIQVNYGLFSVCLTSYIVFLLSLNAIPGPEIAHRRALCTAAGAAIAMFLHVDALLRHRRDEAERGLGAAS